MEMLVLKSPLSPQRAEELDRLGDEIAEVSAHLEAATARLLRIPAIVIAQSGRS